MRLVFVTQQVDPAHPVLAATVPKLRALAERVDELSVLADSSVAGVLPGNCRVTSFAAETRFGRGLRFARALAADLGRRPRPAAVIAHMCPIYAVLGAPLARPLGVPVLLWYTHPQASPTLRLATRLSSRVLSVNERSFPLRSPKLVGVGHGVDVSAFRCADARRGEGLRAVALGRYSPVKGYASIIRAVAQAADEGVDVRLDVRGAESNAAEQAHRRELDELVATLGVAYRVSLGAAVPPADARRLLAAADVLVSNTRAGSADKVVLEACASCVPALASSPAFDELLPAELRFAEDDADELARRLAELARRRPEERHALGKELRAVVVARHATDAWARHVVELVSASS